jgi:dihydroorotate dehydrogenase
LVNQTSLRACQSSICSRRLLAALGDARTELRRTHKRDVPMLLKIAPDLDDAQIEAIAAMLVTHSVDGVIATNTTLSRDAVKGTPYCDEMGGLSGSPVLAGSNRVIRLLRQHLGPQFPIIGVGGIMSGFDAVSKIEAGADVVQIYTGLIYKGPALVHEVAKALKQINQA